MGWFYFVLPILAVALAWFWVLWRTGKDKLTDTQRWEIGLILSALVLVFLGYSDMGQDKKWLLALPFNALFLGHCVIFTLTGSRELNWKLISLGCVLLSALVIVRFSDLFDSLLIRSLVFLVLGAGLFVVGNLYSRQKKQRAHDHA